MTTLSVTRRLSHRHTVRPVRVSLCVAKFEQAHADAQVRRAVRAATRPVRLASLDRLTFIAQCRATRAEAKASRIARIAEIKRAAPVETVPTFPVARLMIEHAAAIPRDTLPDGFLIEYADALALADAETYDAAFDPDFIFTCGGWCDGQERKGEAARIANLSNEYRHEPDIGKGRRQVPIEELASC
jgi:hypothetical protein